MTISHRLYVGTIGEGLWRSLDGGATFTRTCDGMFVECHVRALAALPAADRVLYLGSEQGLFRSDDGADNWTAVGSPLDGLQVWSILLWHEVFLVGACPARLFRSEGELSRGAIDDAGVFVEDAIDGSDLSYSLPGHAWAEADVKMRPDCPRIIYTRVTSLCAHPGDLNTMWAGVEIDGVYRSRDAGRTWHAVGTGLSSQDIHALAYVPGSGRLLASTNNDVNVSLDDGDTWKPLRLRETLPLPYFRGLVQHPTRPDILFLGNGDAPPGTTGLIARSADGGVTWQPMQMPGRANSTMWNFAVHAADPDLVYASSVSGQVYRSIDGGASWQKLAREFGEIRALAWTP